MDLKHTCRFGMDAAMTCMPHIISHSFTPPWNNQVTLVTNNLFLNPEPFVCVVEGVVSNSDCMAEPILE